MASAPASPGAQAALEAATAGKKAADAACLAMRNRNIHRTMFLFGAGFLVLVTVLAQFLEAPPPGYKPEAPPQGGAAAAATAVPMDLAPGQMLRTPLFYLLWIMFACGSGAGLMIIANITTIAKIGKIEAGFILVALLAVGNASGRIVAGLLSDRIGRLWTMFIIFAFQAVLMMVLRTGLSDMVAFIVVSMLLGFNYGACLSVFPSATKDNFGLKNFGVNYGLVFTSWGVGGFVFPLLAGATFEAAKRATGAGSYDGAYLIAALVLVFAAALTFVTRVVETRYKRARALASDA
ncbi:MAG: OFA family MFS transporter [Deltaproteobacteria bacterium]|nr:OFA family MFS transporter [Deltaproteobacteria bacterium]